MVVILTSLTVCTYYVKTIVLKKTMLFNIFEYVQHFTVKITADNLQNQKNYFSCVLSASELLFLVFIEDTFEIMFILKEINLYFMEV